VVEEMAERKGFEFLEHTADVYIAAFGKDLAEAFENAAVAMFDVMTEVEKISPVVEDKVEVTGEDEFALLYNWLEALLVKFDISGMLYSKFEVWHLGKIQDRLVLNARIWGEEFDPRKHLQKDGVKAVTYHRMEIIKHPSEVTVRFILDI
jgi:SHS2 domain-containing protein